MPNRNALIIVVAVIAVVAGATIVGSLIVGSSASSASSPSSAESMASTTVAEFGQALQQVSIMAPNASSMIASTYAPYVDPALLAQWEANPTSAPGRVVSSPWPDHIQINSITPQGAGYIVDGTLVFMTSENTEHGGNAGTTPVIIQLQDENGKWLIVALQGQNSTSGS